jgi:hypothetical protein
MMHLEAVCWFALTVVSVYGSSAGGAATARDYDCEITFLARRPR